MFSTSELNCRGFGERCRVCIMSNGRVTDLSKGPGTVADGLWVGGTVVLCDGQIPIHTEYSVTDNYTLSLPLTSHSRTVPG